MPDLEYLDNLGPTALYGDKGSNGYGNTAQFYQVGEHVCPTAGFYLLLLNRKLSGDL